MALHCAILGWLCSDSDSSTAQCNRAGQDCRPVGYPAWMEKELILKTKKPSPVKSGGLGRLHAIGRIRSTLKTRAGAPKQGSEGAPDAWLEVIPSVARGLRGLKAGDDIIVVTWLHRARREVLKVHPRSDRQRPLTGVFATRSPDRPNPLGLHRVTVRRIDENRVLIGPIEAIDGTPVVDIKPVIGQMDDF
jgi:tRNA-Thr(GGU) m(6)t(6)A37 methyltransferase TsaA